jgi:hypothetical protein
VTTTAASCTVSEMILLAAAELEEKGQSPFSAEALVVAAWQKFPDTFGLKGFAEQYPDSNKVLASIMGQKGLARRAWLAKMGQKRYALTREGRQAARHLRDDSEEAPAPPQVITLARDQDKFLRGLFASTAWQKFHEGRKTELSFADASRFWDLTESLQGAALDARLERFANSLTALKRLIGRGSATLSNGHSVGADDVVRLGQLHTFLEGRFTSLLTLLRNRPARN